MHTGIDATVTIEIADSPPSFDVHFRQHYTHIARTINRVVGDAACAEDLTLEVFWRFWRNPGAQGDRAGGWLHRTAIHLGVSELRRRARHARYERLFRRAGPQNPEELHAANEEQHRVRQVLAAIEPRQAELLLMRSDDAPYAEIADALQLNPASIGTLTARARQAFRKEYIKRYGEPKPGK